MRRMAAMATGLIVLSLMLVPQMAFADIGDVLGEIEWGDDRDEVIEKLRTAKLAELREDSSLRRDQSAMQTARQRTLDRVRGIEDSYTELQGESTDYDVSVIAGEFTSDNNESFLRVRDDVAQRYYFFLEGEFYKLVVAYDHDYVANVGFETFVDQTRQEYGSPTSTERGRVGGHEDMLQAVWTDGNYKLSVDNKRAQFGTFTMTFSDRQRVEELERQGETFGGNDVEEVDTGVSQRVEAVTGPSDEARNENVVGEMVGGDELDVDFSTDEDEKREEEEAEREETAAASSADDDSDDEPATSGRQHEPPSADEEDDGEDLMIY